MNWKLLIIGLSLVVGTFARPAEETVSVKVIEVTTAHIAAETTNLTEKPASAEALIATTTPSKTTPDAPTTVRYELLKKHDNIVSEKQLTDENRELKASSNLQLTSNNGVGSEISIKESYHHGVAVPLSLEEYEKELAREKDMINKAKKKIAMESSTPKEGISTWILLSGSNDPPTTSRPEPVKPTYRIESVEKKPPVKNATTATTKKRNPATQAPKIHPKPTHKAQNNKLVTRVKVTSSNEASNEEEVSTTSAAPSTTKKSYQTTTKKKFTTTRAKPSTTTRVPSTTKVPTTVSTTTSTTEKIIEEDSMVIDDEKDEIQSSTTESASFLIMEAKESEFNLPDDRSPSKSTAVKKTTSTKPSSTKTKKKKITATIAPSTNSTGSTKIKKKTKTAVTKISSKKPEKPISTQIYNFLAREVMPSVGVGLVGLVVTAGLATYFLGGPLGALRRSYDIANRRDDVAFDRSDDFGNGNAHDEGEMFGKVIAGMPENSAYRNNLRINSYRQKVGPAVQPGQVAAAPGQYNTYPQYAQQKYQAQLAQQAQQQQYLRYRNADPYYNSYPQQNYVQQPQTVQTQQQQQQSPYYQAQAKSSEYGTGQSIQAITENNQKFNIESVDMTTSEPSSPSYQIDYDEIAQSYFPQRDDTSSQQDQMSIEQQKIQEVEVQKPQPQYQPQSELRSNEKVTIVNAQSVPSNHKNDGESLPEPEALKMLSGSDEEYQNSIANAILNQQNQRKQFVVGSVISENFEDSPGSIVPEHGPRRRRNASEIDNEIDLEGDEDDQKRQTEVEEITTSSTTSEAPIEENETTTQTYDISNGQNNIFQLFRRIVELKLRLGINFLQNATVAFQQYLRGVEERVHSSSLFNPYINSTSSNSTMSRKSNKKVE